MTKDKIRKLFSFNNISLIVGITGGLATFLSVIITDWSLQISLKWLIFTIYIAFTSILFLIKLVVDINFEANKKQTNFSTVVRFIPEASTFLINKSDYLGYSAMVSIFYLDDAYEVEFGKGYVKNIQENFMQIQLLKINEDFEKNYSAEIEKINSNNGLTLQKLIVKSYIKYTE